MPKTFPQKPCVYKETKQTVRARERQRKKWKAFLAEPVEFSETQPSSSGTRLMSLSVSGIVENETNY